MKLYKFRSFDRFEYIEDILLNRRLYCAEYQILNDPFEGLYLQTVYPRVGFFNRRQGAPERTERQTLRRGLPAIYAEKRICSLSDHRAVKDTRMWAHYAGGHSGVAIEFDFSDHEEQGIHQVKYMRRLPEFIAVGPPLAETEDSPSPEFVLTRKTKPWKYEHEWRIIRDDQYFQMIDRPSAVLVGIKITDADRERLKQITSPINLELVTTKIDDSGKVLDPRTAS